MVTGNDGQYYTSEMLERAEREIEKEKQRILKENEDQRQRETETLRTQLKGEALKKAEEKLKDKHEQEARWQAERSTSVLGNIVAFFAYFVKKVFKLG